MTPSYRTLAAIEMNRSNHALTLRERIDSLLANHNPRRRFTMRGIRRALGYRHCAIWNVRRVIRAMIYSGVVVVCDVIDKRYIFAKAV